MAYTREQETKSKHTEFEWDSVGNPIAQRSVVESDELKTHTGDLENENNELSVVAFEDSSIASKENDQSIQAVTEGDRLLSFADIDFDYDDCGNQISELGLGIKTQRGFNAFNQLTSFSKDGVLTQYDYDPLGRRIAKHTEQGQIDFIWDGNQLLGECLNGKYTWYINRPDEFHPVALIKQDSVYYYHLDQLNTPRFVTNQAAEVVWENTANAYGYEESGLAEQQNSKQQAEFYQPIRFQGQYFDQESGFHYNRFRYYCPKQQRFIHQDPIGLLGGINHYQYTPNPVNWIDPMGLCKEDNYESRKVILASSNGSTTTLDAFTHENATGKPWEKAALDENWLDERRLLHIDILEEATNKALSKTQTLVGVPAIHAMRGNTGAGKSRLMKSGVIPELAQGDIPVINPDNFKPDLIAESKKDGIELTHNQVHWEAAMLSNKLKDELLKPENQEKVPSIIVDKRLGGLYEIEGLHEEALSSGRQLNVFDVDAPLEMSLLGVLLRIPGGDDPIVPFDVVAGGFMSARGNREQFIQYYEENSELGRYELHHTLADGSKELVAVVDGGATNVYDYDAYEELTVSPKVTVDKITEQKITSDEISRITSSLPESAFKKDAIKALNANKGKTWKQAIDDHGGN